jgi:hypothetical protein
VSKGFIFLGPNPTQSSGCHTIINKTTNVYHNQVSVDDIINIYLGRGKMTAMVHEAVVTLDGVPIGYVFVGIITELKIYRIYKSVLLII